MIRRRRQKREIYTGDQDPGQAGKPDVHKPGKAGIRSYYERHLPHQVPEGFPIFLTWNLKGSLPSRVLEELELEQTRLQHEPKRIDETDSERKVRHGKILFAKRDQSLDAACGDLYVSLSRLTGQPIGDSGTAGKLVRLESLTYEGRPMWLADPRAAGEVVKSILWGVPERYELFAYAVLGNHVHVLLKPLVILEVITQGIKGFSAFQINRLQQAKGRTVWQDESYDHWTRDERELFRIIDYIENNPVAARLCRQPDEWVWSSAFCRKKAGWTVGEPFPAASKDLVLKLLDNALGVDASKGQSAWKG